ncbi:VanW family protein [Falsibacillus pallidus]|uniref:VanW like protein n=1 Tax=Falsibacillus pallidus TaxID=493781 RepID=A0A370GNY4_9BACI|nr:VanW family protein [Falsibacillus pallidus]RDI44164.1 VanW like protein [Falsibacillus pallidus]
MKRRHITQIILILLVSTGFLLLFSQSSTFAIQTFFQQESGFPSQTYIGPVEISSLSKEEAINKLRSRVNEWTKNTKISASILDTVKPLPTDFFQFDIEASVDNAVEGKRNPLVVNIPDDHWREMMRELNMSLLSSHIDMNQANNALIPIAESLDTKPFILSLADYLKADSIQGTIASSVGKETGYIDLLSKWVGEYKEITIPPGSELSLKEYMEQKGAIGYSNEFLTMAASLIYETALKSNVKVIERHISENKPMGINDGFEAKIDDDYDLKLYNGKNQPVVFTSELDKSGHLNVYVSLKDDPFRYELKKSNEKQYPPREIIEYEPILGQKQDVPGREGYSVDISKEIYYQDILIKSEPVSKDFYLPIDNRVYKELPDPSTESTLIENSGTENADVPQMNDSNDPSVVGSNDQSGSSIDPSASSLPENDESQSSASDDPTAIYDNETIVK